MEIARSPGKERIILDALRASFTEVRTGVHLSDLLKVRQAYWGRVLPSPPTDIDVLYFLAGRGHEEVFARLCGVQVGASEAKHVGIPEFVAGEQRFKRGISYRPDFRWYALPAEFKTRRSNLAKEGEEAVTYDNYLEQAKGYAALDEVKAAHLIVLSLLEGRNNSDPLKPTHPELAVYDVEWSDGELSQMNDYLDKQHMAFALSLAFRNHEPLPLCAPWMCGKNVKTVTKAAHCVECDKDLAEPWASRHAGTKGGAGHTVAPEEVRWDYTPRCKYYVYCRPQVVDPTRGARSSEKAVDAITDGVVSRILTEGAR